MNANIAFRLSNLNLRATSENKETYSTVKLVHHVIFIERPQLLHITTVGFDKANARMNPPAN